MCARLAVLQCTDVGAAGPMAMYLTPYDLYVQQINSVEAIVVGLEDTRTGRNIWPCRMVLYGAVVSTAANSHGMVCQKTN